MPFLKVLRIHPGSCSFSNSFSLSEARATTGCRLCIALSEEKNPTTALVTGIQGSESVTLFIVMKVKIIFLIGYGMTALRMCAIMPSFHLTQGDINPSVFQLLDIVDTGYHSSNTSPQEVWICEPSVLTN